MKSQTVKTKALELYHQSINKLFNKGMSLDDARKESLKVYRREYVKQYNKDHPEAYARYKKINNIRNKKRNSLYRFKILKAYGDKCACCGENIKEFLTIDHINNDGNVHRALLGTKSSLNMYTWIIKNNFPKTLQILCYNCNNAKSRYGRCPHEKSKDKK